MVLDEEQAELSGKWSHSVHTRPFVGQGYHHCVAGKGQKATFTLRVPESGHYESGTSLAIGGRLPAAQSRVPCTGASRRGGRPLTFPGDIHAIRLGPAVRTCSTAGLFPISTPTL